MRELKFRGWNPTTLSFHYIDLSIGDENYIDRDIEVLEQFTGLEDGGGVDIYEGDIVCFWDDQPTPIFQDKYRGIIKWDEEECQFFISPNDLLAEWDHVEIIGNIHQNPELLK